MVLLRPGRFGVARGHDKSKLVYYEDSVWTTRKEAALRVEQLENIMGNFGIIDHKTFTNAPDEYIVWISHTKKKGTQQINTKLKKLVQQQKKKEEEKK
jgi:hypothetical protein